MATVIERERPVGGGVLIERDSGTGWAVAAVVIIALLAVGAFVWARYYSAPAPAAQNPGASINVTLPQTGGTGETQNTGGSGSQSGGNNTQTPTQ